MNKSLLSLCVALTVLAVAFAEPTWASSKKKPTPEPVRPFISAVSGDTVTVTTGQTAKTLTLKSNSEVLINGQKAAPTDLKAGMIVNSLGVGTDPAVVSRISAAENGATQAGSPKQK